MSCLSFGHNLAGSHKPALTSQRFNIAEDWIQSWCGKLDANLEDFWWRHFELTAGQLKPSFCFANCRWFILPSFILSFLFPVLVISVFIAYSPLFLEHPIIWTDTTRLVTHKLIFIVSTCFLAQETRFKNPFLLIFYSLYSLSNRWDEEERIRKLKVSAGTAGRSEWGIKLHDGERDAVSSCSYRGG